MDSGPNLKENYFKKSAKHIPLEKKHREGTWFTISLSSDLNKLIDKLQKECKDPDKFIEVQLQEPDLKPSQIPSVKFLVAFKP